MTELKLDVARKILDAALAEAAELKLNPLAVTVLDVRGATKAFAAQDGTSLLRGDCPRQGLWCAIARHGIASDLQACDGASVLRQRDQHHGKRRTGTGARRRPDPGYRRRSDRRCRDQRRYVG